MDLGFSNANRPVAMVPTAAMICKIDRMFIRILLNY
jgi:hypothetical protein